MISLSSSIAHAASSPSRSCAIHSPRRVSIVVASRRARTSTPPTSSILRRDVLPVQLRRRSLRADRPARSDGRPDFRDRRSATRKVSMRPTSIFSRISRTTKGSRMRSTSSPIARGEAPERVAELPTEPLALLARPAPPLVLEPLGERRALSLDHLVALGLGGGASFLEQLLAHFIGEDGPRRPPARPRSSRPPAPSRRIDHGRGRLGRDDVFVGSSKRGR